jgi:hypothetical protein
MPTPFFCPTSTTNFLPRKQATTTRWGMVIAVFLTVDGNFRYAVDMEAYGALQFFNEEKLVGRPSQAEYDS